MPVSSCSSETVVVMVVGRTPRQGSDGAGGEGGGGRFHPIRDISVGDQGYLADDSCDNMVTCIKI